ncbi:MAG TPA: hypothetical protein VEB86_16305 [Chryseosolibacter sp.]|nr:hypothetical protein [Chryseosolibacter sp.]
MYASDRYKTILVIVTGLLACAVIFKLPVLIHVALAMGVVAIFIAAAARLIEWLWFRMAMALGWVNSRILLSIVFFGFLLPMAWFSRWFRKDSLNLKRSNAGSIFDTRNYKYRKEDLENIW